jgi:hypothetical protein
MTDQSIAASMPAGLRLLLLASRFEPGKIDGEELAEAAHAVQDWPAFLALVDRHRLAPLVYRSLKYCPEGDVEPARMQGLRTRTEKNTFKALLQVRELVRISDGLKQKGIACLGYKGPVLAVQAYGDISLRHAGDLDLVVPADRVAESERILLQLGYIRVRPSFVLTRRQWRVYRRWFADFSYIHPGHGLNVELHWRFFSGKYLLSLDPLQVFAASRVMLVAGSPVGAMVQRDLLLLLCVHGAKHGWFRLFWLADIHALLVSCRLDEQRRLYALAGNLGVDRMFLQALVLAHRLYRSPVGPDLLAAAEADGAVQSLIEDAMAAIDAPQAQWSEQGARSFSVALSMLAYSVRLRRGWRHCWSAVAGIWVSPEDWRRFPLPDALFFLYYPLRVVLRLGSYLRNFIAGRR